MSYYSLLKPAFLVSCLFLIATSCVGEQNAEQNVSGKNDASDGSNLLQWQKDVSEIHRLCWAPTRIPKIEIDGTSHRCGGLSELEPIIYESWPNLKATVRGECRLPRAPKVSAVCEVEQGEVTDVRLFRGEYSKASRACTKGLYKYDWKGRPWVHSKSIVLHFGFQERDMAIDDDYTITGVVKWEIYDPAKSSLERPPLYFVIGEKKMRFTCIVNNGVVQNYAFSDVGNLTWTERGKLAEFKFY